MYHLPPNNAIGVITDLNQPDSLRQSIEDLERKRELRDKNNVNDGTGPVRGWGAGFPRRAR